MRYQELAEQKHDHEQRRHDRQQRDQRTPVLVPITPTNTVLIANITMNATAIHIDHLPSVVTGNFALKPCRAESPNPVPPAV